MGGSRTVLITGVSKGIGRAIAIELANRGHTVIGCSRAQDKLNSLQSQVSSDHLFLNADVKCNNSVQEMARIVMEKRGVPPDVIVNSAGTINKNNKMWEVPEEEFDEMMDTNLKGTANVLRHFIPLMTMANQNQNQKKEGGGGGGIIVNNKTVLLNSESVHSTLSRCPSDLIALSFFLWSAQRRDHDFLAFDRMVPVLARLTHRYKTLQTILSELESVGCLSLTNRNPKSFLLLLKIFWRAGMHAMLIHTYHHMQSHGFVPNTFARNLLMDALFRTGQPQLAFSVFKHTHTPNFFTFNIALFHLSNLNHITHITHILRLMLRMRYYPNAVTFHVLFNSFCNMNALPQAYQLLGLMIALGIEFSVNVWTVLIHKYCKSRRLDVATNLFHNMIQAGCSPNVVTYTTLFKAFMESNLVTDAFHLLNTMLSAGQIPDLVLYNVLIDCLSKVGRYQDAIEVFLSLSEQNIKPDSYTFTSLLSTICLSRMFYLLPKLVRDCRHIEADLVFCNALLSSFIKAEHPSLAVGFYDHMIDEGFEPDKYSFAGLLSALCAVRRIDEAVNVYRGVVMTYHATDAHIHTVITCELIKAGKYHKAASVFRLAAVEKYPLDNVAYAVGIYAFLRSGRTLEASRLFVQMKDNGLEPNIHTYNVMLFTFCKEKDIQMVKQMLKEMIDSRIELSDRNFFNLCKFPCSLDAYSSILNLLAEMRDLGLLSSKPLHALSFDSHAEGVKAKYKHCVMKLIHNGT